MGNATRVHLADTVHGDPGVPVRCFKDLHTEQPGKLACVERVDLLRDCRWIRGMNTFIGHVNRDEEKIVCPSFVLFHPISVYVGSYLFLSFNFEIASLQTYILRTKGSLKTPESLDMPMVSCRIIYKRITIERSKIPAEATMK